MTEHGRLILSELVAIVAQEEVLRLAYDGLTTEYKVVDNSLRWRPRDLRDHDILEIPAFPADPPTVGPSETSAVRTALDDVTRKADKELLTVLGLAEKREKFFLRAVALVFESADRADETSVHFIIDGRASEQHDLAFARAEGQRKLGIVGSLRESASAVDAVIGDQLVAQRTDETEIIALRRLTEDYKNQLVAVEARTLSATDQQQDDLVDKASTLAVKLDEAEAALAAIPVRVLEVHEHAPLLFDALKGAREKLLIVSPWIRAAVVTPAFMAALETLLKKGVTISIGYGIGDDGGSHGKDRDAEAALKEMALKYANFNFRRLGDTHAKVLILDERYAVVTSFNWLSFKGDPDRPFRDERGTLITLASEIERLYQDYFTRISSSQGSLR
nr:phospholipase D-like domain-containing protein [Jiangella mangrovi]